MPSKSSSQAGIHLSLLRPGGSPTFESRPHMMRGSPPRQKPCNGALNLGLSLHGSMNLYNLDIIPPDGGDRTDSPLVYPLDDEMSWASRSTLWKPLAFKRSARTW